MSKLSMSHIRLTELADVRGSDEVLVILRNMAGEDEFTIAVIDYIPIWCVKHWVSMKKRLPNFTAIKLAIDCDILNDRIKMRSLRENLRESNNVIQLLVDPGFVCPNCQKVCQASECINWSDDPADRCTDCNDEHPHLCECAYEAPRFGF